jgi:hypothetical protein
MQLVCADGAVRIEAGCEAETVCQAVAVGS